MFDRVALKAKAKEQIKGKIGILFLCSLVAVLVISVSSCVSWLIAPVIVMGINMLYLGLINNQEPKVETVFKGFDIFGKTWWLYFLTQLFISLWTLLFIVPGIIKAYSYSMAPYILAENPTMTAREALNESKRITNGAKMDLFILEFSFFGWLLLCVFTFGIAMIYVAPYMNTTLANAYQSLKTKEQSIVE